MRKYQIIFIILCFSINTSHAQSAKYFERFFYTDTTIVPTKGARGMATIKSNNHYLVSGPTEIINNGPKDGFILKINELGDSIIVKENFSENDKTLIGVYTYYFNDSYFFLGNFVDLTNNISNIFLIKLDTNFIELSRNYLVFDTSFIAPVSGVIMGSSMNNFKFLSDSTFLIMGSTNIPDTIAKPIYFKVDTLGNILWRKKLEQPISGMLNTYFNDAIELPDSNLIFVGHRNFNFQNSDIWIAKTDKNGNLLWDRNWYSPPSNSTHEFAFGILYLPQENNLLVACTKGDFPYVFKIDTSGVVLQIFDMVNYENGAVLLGGFNNIIKAHDGNYIAFGSRAKQSNNIVLEGLVVKYNTFGNVLWTRSYIGYGYGRVGFQHGIATSDGGYLFTGAANLAVYNQNSLKQIVYVVKTNCLGFTGPPQAQMQCSGNGLNYTFTNLSERADTCYLDFGDGSPVMVFRAEHDTLPINHTYATQGNYQITLIATACGEADTMVCSFNTSTGALYDVEEELSVYPNPVINQITIKAAREIQSIKIYNSLGALVYSETGINTNTKMINVETLKSGIYFVEAEGVGYFKNEKFIKH